MDRFCIRVLSGKCVIWSVKCTELYMTIIIFSVQCDVNQATNDKMIKFADNVCLSGSLLNFRAKGN